MHYNCGNDLTSKHFFLNLKITNYFRENAPNDPTAVTECKPLWEDGGLGIGLARREAGVWEMRTKINNTMLVW